ncbi:MAG: ribosome maturation factor RimM [Bacteroidetes bacterium]|nr:ribosome maturation factor RimM [Bacteroidota bacterium]
MGGFVIEKCEMDDFILIGIARKVRGNKGDLKVESMSDFPQRFSMLKEVFVRKSNSAEAVKMQVEKSEFVNNYAVMKFRGVDSYDDAATFVGSEVLVPESERMVPPDGSYFIDSLLGMTVKNEAGETVGIVENVLMNLNQSILLITMEDGTEFNLPFVDAFVKKVDQDKREITVELIEGIVESTAKKVRSPFREN